MEYNYPKSMLLEFLLGQMERLLTMNKYYAKVIRELVVAFPWPRTNITDGPFYCPWCHNTWEDEYDSSDFNTHTHKCPWVLGAYISLETDERSWGDE